MERYLPVLVKDVRNTGGGDTGGVDCELVAKAVVVEFHTGAAVFIGYHVGITVKGATVIRTALYRTVRILR